ncbi:MAG: 3-octaprenyl-4-hydroxybenzoate decarboxylase, partial [Nitrospinota bacterium]
MAQDLRSFIGDFEKLFPEDLIRISDPVDLKYDIMALVLEYERRKRFPILFFENVRGHDIPVT